MARGKALVSLAKKAHRRSKSEQEPRARATSGHFATPPFTRS